MMTQGEDMIAREMMLGLVTAHGNIVGSLAAAATRAGIPAAEVRSLLLALNEFNRETIESQQVTSLLSDRIATTIELLDQNSSRPA
jgi:uncharacterized protein (DUF697 family)